MPRPLTKTTGLFERSKALFSLESIEYFIPKTLYEDLNKKFNFILDPCTTSDNPLKTKYFFKEDDGLTKSWNFKGAVFCNPSYGKFIKYWVKKSYQDHIKHNITITIVMLLFVRTDTKSRDTSSSTVLICS